MNLNFKNVFYSFLLVALTTFLFHQYYSNKVNHNEYSLYIKTIHDREGTLELYYDLGTGFNENDKLSLKVNEGPNESIFKFDNQGKLRKIRLDFGSNSRDEIIVLEKVELGSGNKILFSLNKVQSIRNIAIFSPNIQVDNYKLKIVPAEGVFDPYVEFKTLNRIIIPDWTFIIIIVLPILIINIRQIYQYFRHLVTGKEVNHIIICLFLITIPFKDAWTTLVVIIWIGYVIIEIIKKNYIIINIATFLLLGLFLIPLIFGKVSSYNQINILLSFLLFTVISLNPDRPDLSKIREIYPIVFNVIAIVIIGSWLNYLTFYASYDDINLISYFKNIKYTNESIREWMGFSQPAFLSIFSVIAVQFSVERYKLNLIKLNQLITGVLLNFILIIVLGSRIGLLLFILLPFFALIPKKNYKNILLVIYIFLSITIFTTISKVDIVREQLWNISFTAIKEKLLFGYGLESSKDIISNQKLNTENGYDILLKKNHPHNQYISYILEIGSIGFATLLMTLLIIYFKNRIYINNRFATLLFIWGLLAIVESPFETSKPTFLFCFFLLISGGNCISKVKINRSKLTKCPN